jgi:predicted phage replisome organizer
MAENGKYYWLKLKRDFFKRHDIRIIEEMPNGKDYILFYLKLLLESIDHEGSLRFSDTIPYNEQMLSVVTHTNVDIVRNAMKLFIELNMMTVCDDQTIYMNEVEKLIGSETKWAEKKRLQRAKGDNVPELSSNCPIELELNKDKEKDIDITTTTTAHAREIPIKTQVYLYIKENYDGDILSEVDKFYAYNEKRGWDCLPNWQATADLWMARVNDRR